MHFHPVLAENPIQRPAGGNVALKPDELLAVQLLDRETLELGERVLRGADQHQPILAKGRHQNLRPFARVGHYPQVHLSPAHVFIDFVGPSIFKVDSDVREGAQIPLQRGRQFI